MQTGREDMIRNSVGTLRQTDGCLRSHSTIHARGDGSGRLVRNLRRRTQHSLQGLRTRINDATAAERHNRIPARIFRLPVWRQRLFRRCMTHPLGSWWAVSSEEAVIDATAAEANVPSPALARSATETNDKMQRRRGLPVCGASGARDPTSQKGNGSRCLPLWSTHGSCTHVQQMEAARLRHRRVHLRGQRGHVSN